MKPKIFRTKSIIALALALFMVMPMLFAAMPYAKAAGTGTPVLSVVPSGAPGATGTTSIAGLTVGQTLTVDIRVDNVASILSSTVPGINGLSYTLTYDPTVLAYKSSSTKNPSFWSVDAAGENTAADVTSIVTKSAGVFTESADIVPSGANNEATATSGVASSVTFTVLTTGTSNLNLQPSDVGVAYISYPDTAGVSHDLTATTENAIYNLLVTQINAYQFGTSSPICQFPTGTNPVGSTFTVSVNMNNAAAEPIWGWNIGVSWNPAVLQCVGVAEGPYLAQPQGLVDGASTLFIAGQIDNNAGTIKQGISDVYLTNKNTTAQFGILCNITFDVINYANSPIIISAGIPTLIDNASQSQPCSINSAQYVTLPPPAPRAPVAAFYAMSTQYLAGTPITITSNPAQGYDVIPNANSPNFPITTYTWSVVSGPVGFTVPSTNANSITFSGPTPATPITIGLVVSTAANPADPAYNNTSAMATITFTPAFTSPTTAGAQIDEYIVNAGPYTTTNSQKDPLYTSQGIYNNTIPTLSYVDTYAPQELMNLQAFVTYNGGSVANKLVTFMVQSQGSVTNATIATFSAYTDANGIAVASYRLPNYNSAVMPFGNYTVISTVDVAQVKVADMFVFQYNYILNDSVSQPGTTARGQTASAVVTIQDNSFNVSQSYFLTWTVTDNNNVPIFSGSTFGTTTGAITTQPIAMLLPGYSFVGTATLHVNIFNADPVLANGLPYCPESDATFTIAIPAAQQTVPP